MNPFAIIALLFITAVTIYIFYKIWYTKRNGIEAEAVITRIEEEGGANSNASYSSFVCYKPKS